MNCSCNYLIITSTRKLTSFLKKVETINILEIPGLLDVQKKRGQGLLLFNQKCILL